MRAFVDHLQLTLQAGHGGAGAISFARQRNRARGPADGGDGGRGGNIVVTCRANLKTLSHFQKLTYQAESGKAGGRSRCSGRSGGDLFLEVPPGTTISQSGKILAEFKKAGEYKLLLKGGQGGRGNARFSSSRMRSPRFSQPGIEGESGYFQFELHLLADFALVGFPNAGKSYLQNNLTNARPKVAPYPFATRTPNLGVLRFYEKDVVIADIPGILQGAATGFGLGQQFLTHISRSAGLLILVDLNDEQFLEQPQQLLQELDNFSHNFSLKCSLIIATKLDLLQSQQPLLDLQEKYPQLPIVAISNVTREGLEKLKKLLFQLCE